MMSNKINCSMYSIKISPSVQRGVTLLDAMIAILIFSVGILAVAALQTISKQSNFEAIQRTHAASYAYDLFERMRMNQAGLPSYVSAAIITDQTPAACTSACTPSAMALNDLLEWKNMILGAAERTASGSVGGLTSPTACISGPGASGHDYTLTIVWRGQASIENQSASTCGSGSYGTNNVYRRILTISTYI